MHCRHSAAAREAAEGVRRPDAEQGVVLRAADDGDDGVARGGLQDRREVQRQGRQDAQPPPPPFGEWPQQGSVRSYKN